VKVWRLSMHGRSPGPSGGCICRQCRECRIGNLPTKNQGFPFMKNHFLLISVAMALTVSAATPGTKALIEKNIASPSENISLAFHLTEGTPSYEVSF